jgi:pSer/pThr/pTyr-binding forkhead associated (FHA) protein
LSLFVAFCLTIGKRMSDEIPAFTLEFFGGPLAGKSIAPAGSSFRVGRTKTSKLQIKDPAVSEKHAEIAYRDGHWQIRDLGSSNGTVVNNAEVMGAPSHVLLATCRPRLVKSDLKNI